MPDIIEITATQAIEIMKTGEPKGLFYYTNKSKQMYMAFNTIGEHPKSEKLYSWKKCKEWLLQDGK